MSQAYRLPFHVGQTADDANRVVRRSGRTLRALVVEDANGVHRAEFPRRPSRADLKRWEDENIDLKTAKRVTRTYDDCALVFERWRGPDGQGALCFRIVEV